MRLTAKRFILELLSAVGNEPAPVAALIEASAVLGFSENNTRVALARLLAAGTVEASARGAYRLGSQTEALTRQVTSWRELEGQLRRWDGGWVAAFTGNLGRSDRARLRQRARALQLLGFRELIAGLELRPDNFVGGCTSVRGRVQALGLDAEAPVLRAEGLDDDLERRARKLWDVRALSTSYRRTRTRLDAWLEREASLSRRVAARESFLLGSEALRQLLYDPLLPEPLVDVAERRALFDAARRFDARGRRIWHELFGIERGFGVASADEPPTPLH